MARKMSMPKLYYASAPQGRGIKQWCASDDVCLSRTSGLTKSRTERPILKIGTEVAHITRRCDSLRLWRLLSRSRSRHVTRTPCTFNVRRSKVNLPGAGAAQLVIARQHVQRWHATVRQRPSVSRLIDMAPKGRAPCSAPKNFGPPIPQQRRNFAWSNYERKNFTASLTQPCPGKHSMTRMLMHNLQ